MQVHPDIAALRGKSASQRRAFSQSARAMRDACREWTTCREWSAQVLDLERYGAGASLSECLALDDVMRDASRADRLVEALCRPTLNALKSHPLGEAAFPFRTSRGVSTLQLFKSGRATLNLVAYEPIEVAGKPQSALFCDQETHELVVQGSACGRFHKRTPDGSLRSEDMNWRAGDRIETRPLVSARQVLAVERSTLVLQLIREAKKPRPACEISLDHGTLVRMASGNKSASQAVMALGVLGALNAIGALEVMERTALHAEEDVDVRWEAVRQTLGLGPKRGLHLLCALIRRAADPLSQPALSLRDHLLASQPELRALAPEEA